MCSCHGMLLCFYFDLFKVTVFVTTNVKHVYVLNIILYHTKYCSTNCITEFQYHAISLYIDKKGENVTVIQIQY